MSNGEELVIPRVFDLTYITGKRKSHNRRSLIGKGSLVLEFNYRTLVIGTIGVVVSVILSAPLLAMSPNVGVIAMMVLFIVWMLLVNRKATSGLRIPLYQSLYYRHRGKARSQAFYRSGHKIDSSTHVPFVIWPSSAPVTPTSVSNRPVPIRARRPSH